MSGAEPATENLLSESWLRKLWDGWVLWTDVQSSVLKTGQFAGIMNWEKFVGCHTSVCDIIWKKKLITVVVPRFTNPLCFIVYSYLLLHLRGSQSHLIQSFMWEMRKQKAIASPRVTTSSKRLPQTGHWGSPWTLTTCCMIQKLESQLVRGQLHLYA